MAQPDAGPPPRGLRAARCTGAAVAVAAGLDGGGSFSTLRLGDHFPSSFDLAALALDDIECVLIPALGLVYFSAQRERSIQYCDSPRRYRAAGGGRVLVLTGGPATLGPGQVVSRDQADAIRTHRVRLTKSS